MGRAYHHCCSADIINLWFTFINTSVTRINNDSFTYWGHGKSIWLLFDWYYQLMIHFPERAQLSRGCWLDLSTHDSLSTCKWMSACFCHSAFICHKLDICGPSDHSTLVNVGPEDSQGPYSQNTRCFPLQKRKKSERTQRHVPSTVLLDVKIDSLCPLSQLEPTSFYL